MKAYILRIELQGVKPLVWRRIIVPAEIPFWRLHQTIQFGMGWRDSHYYQFDFPKQAVRVTNDDEEYDRFLFYCENYAELSKEANPDGHVQKIVETEIRQAEKTKLGNYFENAGNAEYIYDFGDYWIHTLTLEEIRDDYEVGYPQVLAGEGSCPPEDVGGPPGYAEFIKAWSNPKHKDHKDARSWAEGQWWSPFDMKFTNELMKDLLKLKKAK